MSAKLNANFTRFLEPTVQFSQHSTFHPQLFSVKGMRLFFNNSKISLCPLVSSLRIDAFNKTFILNLRENTQLIPNEYFERYNLKNTSVVERLKDVQRNRNHCHFHGNVDSSKDSWVAVSTYNGSITGVMNDGNDVYYIHYAVSEGKHLIFRGSDFIGSNKLSCGVSDKDNTIFNFRSRMVRSLSEHTGEPYKSNTRSRYVELVIVNDHKEFVDNNNDKNLVVERSKQIANIVNALYNQLNIFVALVGVVIWSDHDEIKLSSDGDKTLTNFLHYRRERLVPQHPNDNAQLITATNFDGGVVGKALKGPICTYEYSGGVNTDHSHVIGLVATTVAHELGHNFGMEHDNDKCKCPDEKCIMAPSSSSTSPKHWSSCSIEYLDFAFSRGMDYCLRNIPRNVIGPVCGNGFLEPGEECDCGLKEYCDNPCCNPINCTLVFGAKCATGSCCDLSTCDVKHSSSLCRDAVSECDIPEFCDGITESCPEDVSIHNGVSCGDHDAYCFNKYCQSHESQCKLLWGSTGNVSDIRCFKQNTKGTQNGNCGYNRVNQTYHPCEVEDVLCGMLHCSHLNEKLELGMESAATLQHSFLTVNKKVLACRSAIIDLGLDSTDPGLVPDGAKCGTNKMCVNQKCVSVDSVLSVNPCDSNCNGNGFCDNNGKCHCFDGFGPPNCEFPLPHGYHITLALYIIFLCILPLTSFSAFVAYYFQEHLKTWWIVKARKAAIKSRVKQGTQRTHPRVPSHIYLRSLEISEPIAIEENEDTVSFETIPKDNTFKTRSFRTSFRGLEISAPITQEGSTSTPQHKPVRPAPPPPYEALSRSMSSQSSFRSSSRRSSISRPRCPPPPLPPPPPPPPNVHKRIKDFEEKRALDFSNTNLEFVHKSDTTKHNHPYCGQSVNRQPSDCSSSVLNDSHSKEQTANQAKHSRVELLAKHFESKK